MKKQVLVLLFLAGLFLSQHAAAQNPVTMVLYGALSADSNPVRDTPCKVDFTLSDASDNVLFQNNFEVKTDSEGTFNFTVAPISVVSVSEQQDETFTITMVLNAPGAWKTGDTFTVVYTLNGEGAEKYRMVRGDNQEMKKGSDRSVWLFYDEYPDSYISSTFMISFNKDITDPEKITSICLEMDEWPQGPVKERGYKGGYAVGGYKTAK